MFPSLIHLFYQPVYCVNLRLTAYLNNLLYFDYSILALSGEYQLNCYSGRASGTSKRNPLWLSVFGTPPDLASPPTSLADKFTTAAVGLGKNLRRKPRYKRDLFKGKRQRGLRPLTSSPITIKSRLVIRGDWWETQVATACGQHKSWHNDKVANYIFIQVIQI